MASKLEGVSKDSLLLRKHKQLLDRKGAEAEPQDDSQFHHGGPVAWHFSLVTEQADTIPRGVIWLAKSDATNIQSHSSI